MISISCFEYPHPDMDKALHAMQFVRDSLQCYSYDTISSLIVKSFLWRRNLDCDRIIPSRTICPYIFFFSRKNLQIYELTDTKYNTLCADNFNYKNRLGQVINIYEKKKTIFMGELSLYQFRYSLTNSLVCCADRIQYLQKLFSVNRNLLFGE